MQTYENYKGYEIKFNERKEEWEGFLDDEEVASDVKLSELKKKLDKHKKKEQAFERVEIFGEAHSYGNEGPFKEGVITSVSGDWSVWVTWKGVSWKGKDKREKRFGGGGLYLKTPENLSKREAYEALQRKIEALEEEQKKLLDSMETFKTPKEVNHG